MALVRFGFRPSEIPADAANVKASAQAGYSRYDAATGGYVECAGPSPLWTWETHVGLCLSQYERNGYDDSDFYMVVWNPEKSEPETIMFASTRGWSYPSYASYVDATDEVKAAYAAYQARQARLSRINAQKASLRLRFETARELGVSVAAIKRLEKAYGKLDGTPVHRPTYRERTYGKQSHHDAMALAYGLRRHEQQIDRVLNLAKSAKAGRLRNEFRRKLGEQVLAWLNEPEPRYSTPLSPKQAQYI